MNQSVNEYGSHDIKMPSVPFCDHVTSHCFRAVWGRVLHVVCVSDISGTWNIDQNMKALKILF